MRDSDREQFAALLADVMAFYRQDMNPFVLSVWWAACERFDMEQVRAAITRHAMDPERGQFSPKPADIIRLLEGTATDRSLIAWGKVLDAIQRVGAYTSVVFDDGAIHAAITDMGGWTSVCRSKTEELPFLQRRFCDAHKAYSGRGTFSYPAKLIGEHEAMNSTLGYQSSPPVLVGNVEKAKQIMQSGEAGSKTAITFSAAVDGVRRLGVSQ